MIEAQLLVTASRPRRYHAMIGPMALLLCLVLLGWSTIFGGKYFDSPVQSIVVPWLIMLTVLLWRWSRLRQQRATMRLLARAAEAAEFNNWSAVLPAVRDILGRPVHSANVRAQSLLLYAGAAERQGHYEVSEAVFGAMMMERIGDPVQLHQAAMGMVGTKLRSSQLTDAITMLDRMRKLELPPVLKAGVELLRVFQEVLMGHHDHALAAMEERCELFRRNLSTRAAYGYALYAVALHSVGKAQEAADMWHNATLLMRPERLRERYGLLAVVAERYAPAGWPAL